MVMDQVIWSRSLNVDMPADEVETIAVSAFKPRSLERSRWWRADGWRGSC